MIFFKYFFLLRRLQDVIYFINYTATITLREQITEPGYGFDGNLVLTCEVHGFLLSTNPLIWRRGNDSVINSSSAKYSITTGTTSQSSVLISNGTRVSGLWSTLTIRPLSTVDEGSYSCVADGASSSLELSVGVKPHVGT